MASDEFKGPFRFVVADRGGEPYPEIRDANNKRVRLQCVVDMLNRSPTGLMELVPEGWALLSVEQTSTPGLPPWRATLGALVGHSLPDGDTISEGTGPTPEDAVKDAAKRIGGTRSE